MKVSEIAINEYFEMHSGIKMKRIPMRQSEERLYKGRIKVKRIDTEEIFYFPEDQNVYKI